MDPIRALKGAQNVDRQSEDKIHAAGKEVVKEAERVKDSNPK